MPVIIHPPSWKSLPPVSSEFEAALEDEEVEFPLNEECTSLAIVPSGRHLVGGFTDGTLRLFDLTGQWYRQQQQQDAEEYHGLFDSDSSSSDDDEEEEETPSKARNNHNGSRLSRLVSSKAHQAHGAVACQIHAKGVHTSLKMSVAVSEDGRYAFGGVTRGSMELVAVSLQEMEEHHDEQQQNGDGKKIDNNGGLDMLDLLQVHRHADAKLRGFGACALLQTDVSKEPTYILLTGQGIKNIHIWSFTPHLDQWKCLYDTQTNGTSLSLLHLRYNPQGRLEAISKSDKHHKLRIWDLEYEQHQGKATSRYYNKKATAANTTNSRPRRPPFRDVSSSESALGIAGEFALGGDNYPRISLINLDISAPYNLTELEARSSSSSSSNSSSRRPQRGELKSLVQVAAMPMDSSSALLEMSDNSIIHFHQQPHGKSLPLLENLPNAPKSGACQALSLARIGAQGMTVAAFATKHNIVVRKIANASKDGYWGFHCTAATTNTNRAPSSTSSTTNNKVHTTTKSNKMVPITTAAPNTTPVPTSKKSKKAALSSSKTRTPSVKVHVVPPSTKARAPSNINRNDSPGLPLATVTAITPYTTPAVARNSITTSPKRTSSTKSKPRTKLRLTLRMPSVKPQADTSSIASPDVVRAATSKKQMPSKPPPPPPALTAQESASSIEVSLASPVPARTATTSSTKQVLQRRNPTFKSPKRKVKRSKPVVDDTAPPVAKKTRMEIVYDNAIQESCRDISWNLVVKPRTRTTATTTKNPRVKLVLEHRAVHEALRTQIHTAVLQVMLLVQSGDVLSKEEARFRLEEGLERYSEILDATLNRQELEASTMAELNGLGFIPSVSFPFPEAFHQARTTLDHFLKEF